MFYVQFWKAEWRGEEGVGKGVLDWIKCDDVEYVHIKRRAQDREDWCYWRPGPA